MTALNAGNERVKRRYVHYLAEAKGLVPATVNNVSRYIAEYEAFTDYKDFARFSSKDAIQFRKSLMQGRSHGPIPSRATIYSKLLSLQAFFGWLSREPGFRTKLAAGDCEYFNLARRDRRIALESVPKDAPSLEQMLCVLRGMPAGNDIELRDRALVAFLMLTGSRVSAAISFKLRHLLPDGTGIEQDGKEVRTKGGRSFTTFFFPVAGEVQEIFSNWVEHLQSALMFGPGDPLFPATDAIAAAHGVRMGLTKRHWKTARTLREVCKQASARAGVPYHPPHTLRRMLAEIALRRCRNAEDLRAWSENLGHLDTMTTLISYGTPTRQRRAQLIAALSSEAASSMGELELVLQSYGFQKIAKNTGENE